MGLEPGPSRLQAHGAPHYTTEAGALHSIRAPYKLQATLWSSGNLHKGCADTHDQSLKKMRNPFLERSQNLLAIHIRDIIDTRIVQTVRHIKTLGDE